MPKWVFISETELGRIILISDLYLSKKTQAARVQSSIKVTYYYAPHTLRSVEGDPPFSVRIRKKNGFFYY